MHILKLKHAVLELDAKKLLCSYNNKNNYQRAAIIIKCI